VIDAGSAPQHLDLVQFSLLLLAYICTVAIAQKHLDFVLLVLFELSEFLLFGLDEDFLENQLILLLSFRWEGTIGVACFLREGEADGFLVPGPCCLLPLK